MSDERPTDESAVTAPAPDEAAAAAASADLSADDLFAMLKALVGSLGRDLVERALVLYIVSKAPRVPPRVVAVAVAAIGYLVSPVDGIPDVTPVVGLVDDIAVVAGALAAAAAFVTPEMRAEARRIADSWFG